MVTRPLRTQRRILIPEVVQTSATDCGPAALKCLMEGFGTHVSYGRLREACQTSADGTSIDTVEDLARQLGLDAEQIMLPLDYVLLPEANALPAIIVVNAAGFTHFVVAWRHHLGLVQVMDPAVGRRWLRPKQFRDWLHLHTLTVTAGDWCRWAGSEEAVGCLHRSLMELELSRRVAAKLIEAALADRNWCSLAGLQAATGLVAAAVRSGAIPPKGRSARLLESLFEQVRRAGPGRDGIIASRYWPVLPAPPGSNGEQQLLLQGAVLVRVRGWRVGYHAIAAIAGEEAAGDQTATGSMQNRAATLSPELVAALKEPPSRPGRDLFRMVREDGLLAPAVLATALLLAAASVVAQAVLFRGLLDIGRDLKLTDQRAVAVVGLVVFLGALLMLDVSIASMVLRMGRHLEARLRLAFLDKLPRLADRYFRSRLTSDMAERSHTVHSLRGLPVFAGELLRTTFELVLTTAGIIWLAPASAPLAIAAAAVGVALPLIVQPSLAERDLRVRTHAGALSRFYLDAMLGLIPVRAHAAERAVRHTHERLLSEWSGAALGLVRLAITVGAFQSVMGFALSMWLVLAHVLRPSEAGSVLLLLYWALNLPALGQKVALTVRRYPAYRNVTLRLLEPLGAPEVKEPSRSPEVRGPVAEDEAVKPAAGVAVAMEDVALTLSGHTILEHVDLTIGPGSHVAIVGPSGAGKSSLVGLLLGWNQPAKGRLLVDGIPLDGERLKRLRAETAWADPTVQLWNRSLADNLLYGASFDSVASLGQVIRIAELQEVLETLPDGLQTPLGESGALVSGGEGQRVRLGRAMMRRRARLVILDEPFTGIDRPRREQLILRASELWQHATLLYVTHDIGEASAFRRVLVLEAGRIVEDGAPADLIRRPDSRYRALQDSQAAVQAKFMSSALWRRLRIEKGRLTEGDEPSEGAARAMPAASEIGAGASSGREESVFELTDLADKLPRLVKR
jgi:ABC-type bacteriocin/lantibiotic exporter with double-glycine peptidase domain